MNTKQLREAYHGYGNWIGIIEELEENVKEQKDVKKKSEIYLEIGNIWEVVFLEKSKAVTRYQDAYKLDQENREALFLARKVYREMGKSRMVAQLANLELNLIRENQDQEIAKELFLELGESLTDMGEVERQRSVLKSYKGYTVEIVWLRNFIRI